MLKASVPDGSAGYWLPREVSPYKDHEVTIMAGREEG